MTTGVAAAGLIVGLLGIVLAVFALTRVRRTAALAARRIRSELIASGPVDPHAIRDVAVVRYDALEEMAGQLSFSVAMLNAQGDGVVLTSINGRTETRTYAKVVAEGKGVHQLSPEEQQAVRSAQLGHGPPTLLTQAPRLVAGGHGPVRPIRAPDPATKDPPKADPARTPTQRAQNPPAADEERAPFHRTTAVRKPEEERPDGERPHPADTKPSASAPDAAKPGAPAGTKQSRVS